MTRQTLKAFTLIEVLVVVSIIALLVSILLPSLSAAREQANVVVCKTRLTELFKGHSFYAHDNRTYFPDPDWWLWDGINGDMRNWYPNLYSKTNDARPTDSRRWVEFGHIYKYVKDKEVYFCPKDTKQRTGNSIGGGGTRGSYPIHSYVRFYEPHGWMSQKLGTTGNTIPNAPLPDLLRSDFLKPDMLRHHALSYNGRPVNSTPNRMGLLFEEYQNFGEPSNPSWIGPNKVNTLNDGYSGFLWFTDYLTLRHRFRSHLVYWDGHVSLVDAIRFNRNFNTFGWYMAAGGPNPP